MNIEKIINQLRYLSKSNRVIFWQDDGYFAPMLKEIELALPELKLINAETMLEDVMNNINSYNLTEGFWRLLINNYSANAKDQQLIEFIKST